MGPITPITNSFRSVQTCHRFENWSASAKCFSSFTTLFQETSIQKVRLLGEDNVVAEEHIGYRIAFLQYRRKFWWIAIIFAICGKFSSANLCESPIFSPYTVIYLLFQLSWLLVPCLTINFGHFLCDLFVELPNFSQILVTSAVITFVFLPVLLPNLVIIFKH